MSIDLDCFYLAMLLLDNGLRVSEGLRLSGSQLVDDSRALIPASKGSNPRYADISRIKNYMNDRILYNDSVFYNLSDDYFYRNLRRCNIYFKSEISSKQSITHCFRHVYVQNLRNCGVSDSVIASNLGLKRVRNVEYYGKGVIYNLYS
jgi:integrase